MNFRFFSIFLSLFPFPAAPPIGFSGPKAAEASRNDAIKANVSVRRAAKNYADAKMSRDEIHKYSAFPLVSIANSK